MTPPGDGVNGVKLWNSKGEEVESLEEVWN